MSREKKLFLTNFNLLSAKFSFCMIMYGLCKKIPACFYGGDDDHSFITSTSSEGVYVSAMLSSFL